jgi:NADH-quinone oxidoreductase subunit N
MHFYAADVYEGCAAPVAAFLAFTPKFAGLLAMMMLLSTIGYKDHFRFTEVGLPPTLQVTLWIIAVLTMTLGNVGALLQKSIKRILAYSSIAHSGYMLIGIIAGPGLGFSAVLFYMLAYAVMNTAAFAVLAALHRRGQELETLEDLAGLRQRHPWMAAVMAVSALSLIGLPPLLGFWGKLYLFIAGIEAGHILLVIIAGLNSAISAWYYLGLVKMPVLEQPSARAETVVRSPSMWPRAAGLITAAAIIIMPLFTRSLLKATDAAVSDITVHADAQQPRSEPAQTSLAQRD